MNIFRNIRDLNLRTKLIMSYIFLIAVPTVIIGYVYYNTSSDIILKSSNQNIYEIIKKNNQIIDIKLSQIQENAQNLLLDNDLYNTFSTIKPDDKYGLIKADQIVSGILEKYFSRLEDVYSAYIATSYYDFGRNNITLSKRDSFSKTRLYTSALGLKGKLQWIPTYNIQDMFGINPIDAAAMGYPYIFSAVKQLNLISVEISGSYSQAWDSQAAFEMKSLDAGIEHPVLVINFNQTMLEDIFKESVKIKDANYYIISRDGDIISSSDKSKIARNEKPVWLNGVVSNKSGTEIITIDGRKMLICFDTLNANGWASVIVTPVDRILSTLPLVRYYTLYLGIALTLIAILLSFVISGWFIKPLKKLLVGIIKMSKGDFDTEISVHSKDEIGFLVDNFNVMNKKIQSLIEENYKTKIREKEVHIMALNLQLNPHFMSNTLNTINWMAIENGQKNISKMIVNLSTMLQYTMRNAREIVYFKEDMEWLKSYIYIMSNRYPGLFVTKYAFDDAFNDQMVPKLFLQPFVENSIIHGFESMESGGIIEIYGKIEDKTKYIYVSDNGKGMTSEEIIKAKNVDGDSIGIKNIDKRIKLIYGEEFGVNIVSECGKGTKVEITMPSTPDGSL